MIVSIVHNCRVYERRSSSCTLTLKIQFIDWTEIIFVDYSLLEISIVRSAFGTKLYRYTSEMTGSENISCMKELGTEVKISQLLMF